MDQNLKILQKRVNRKKFKNEIKVYKKVKNKIIENEVNK